MKKIVISIALIVSLILAVGCASEEEVNPEGYDGGVALMLDDFEDGDDAIKHYRKSMDNGAPFDVVIMDLNIRGGVGGGETIQKLIEIDPDVKAIVSSGYSSDKIMANYDQYGFCGVISKPYDIEKLSELLSKILNGGSSA